VYNASLLGSRLLARVSHYSGEKMLFGEAAKSVAFCCDHQREDGSWGYGTLAFHQWVDNFHTGYNLECISDYMKFSKDHRFKTNVDIGFEYTSKPSSRTKAYLSITTIQRIQLTYTHRQN
jgi:hypothetical protein